MNYAADLTVDANTTTFVYAMNVNAKMLLGNGFIVDTCISMVKAVALCKPITM